MQWQWVLLYAHVAANLVWIGSILGVGVLLCAPEGTTQERAALALRLYRTLAVPAFVVAFVTGLGQLLANAEYYFVVKKFMHAKLLFALIVIGIHHVLGARAKRLAAGKTQDIGPARVLTIVLGVAAALAAFFVIREPF
jgi:putative membrane protein